ncbi:MAG: hypothetical protein ACPG7F_07485 [Aggregatilineales bacterium]
MYRPIILLVCFFAVSLVSAQTDSCRAAIETAFSSLQTTCPGTIGTICYGTGTIESVLDDDAAVFAAPGNTLTIDGTQFIATQSGANYGISRIDFANDDSPAGMTVLIYGDTAIRNGRAQIDPAQSRTFIITAQASVNVRRAPSTESGIVGGLIGGGTALVSGRNADNSWLYIDYAGSDGIQGAWVFAQLFQVSLEDVARLPLIESDERGENVRIGTLVDNMFAITGTTRPCDDAPADGILLQSSDENPFVELRINAATLRLNGTAFLQSVPGQAMTIYTLEGMTRIKRGETIQFVPAGTQLAITLDSSGGVIGGELVLVPLNTTITDSLILTALPRPIDPAIALSQQAIADINRGLPIGGTWQVTHDKCFPENIGTEFEITGDAAGNLFLAEEIQYTPTEGNLFTRSDGNWQLRVASPDTIEFELLDGSGCIAIDRWVG